MPQPDQTQSSVPSAPVFNVDAAAALKWTLLWIIVLTAYAVGPYVLGAYAYATYKRASVFAILLLASLIVVGVLTAWKFIGGKKEDSPWYTSGFLVALLIFWALAPPIWFFLEYYMFDTGAIQLPQGVKQDEHFKQIKAYADLSSKVWAGAGATLGGEPRRRARASAIS